MQFGMMDVVSPVADVGAGPTHGSAPMEHSSPFIESAAPAEPASIHPTPDPGDVREHELTRDGASLPFVPPAPFPVLGSIPVGGVILSTGAVLIAAAQRFVALGTVSERPGVMGVLLTVTVGAVQVLDVASANGGGLGVSGYLPPLNLPVFIPVKGCTLLIPAAASVSWLVIGSDIPNR